MVNPSASGVPDAVGSDDGDVPPELGRAPDEGAAEPEAGLAPAFFAEPDAVPLAACVPVAEDPGAPCFFA